MITTANYTFALDSNVVVSGFSMKIAKMLVWSFEGERKTEF